MAIDFNTRQGFLYSQQFFPEGSGDSTKLRDLNMDFSSGIKRQHSETQHLTYKTSIREQEDFFPVRLYGG
jgi:hypothetical protein